MKIIVLFSLIFSIRAFALLGDGGAGWAQIPYFVKILGENIKRYRQLKIMIGEAREHRQYLRVIHAGLENSIGLLDSLPIEDEKIMAELVTFKKSLDAVANVYGKIPKSKEALLHTLHDQTVAESLRMITSFKNFTRQQEENSMRISIQGRQASPKGAARMQVESSAQILKSLNQLIRLNTQMLKLQSESLAMNNKTDKDSVHRFQKIDQDLGKGFKNLKLNAKLFRY